MNSTTKSTATKSIATPTILRSKRMRFALVAAVSAAGLAFSAGNAAADTPPVAEDVVVDMPEATCPKDGKIDVAGSHTTVTVTAPDGMLIAGYCVKAGSANQGDGPESFIVDPPVAEITFGHSSGKDISHYTIVYVEAPDTPEDKTPPADEPDEPDTPDTPEDKAPPVDEPDQPDVPEDTTPAPVDEPAPLPQPEPFEAESAPVVPQPEVPAGEATVPVPVATGELPVTGSTTTVLAIVAGLVTSLGLAARRIARRSLI